MLSPTIAYPKLLQMEKLPIIPSIGDYNKNCTIPNSLMKYNLSTLCNCITIQYSTPNRPPASKNKLVKGPFDEAQLLYYCKTHFNIELFCNSQDNIPSNLLLVKQILFNTYKLNKIIPIIPKDKSNPKVEDFANFTPQ